MGSLEAELLADLEYNELGEGVLAAAEAAPAHCITDGYPLVLHCFPAHVTDLQKFQRDELDYVANQIRNGDITGRRIATVRIVGHAATWQGLTKAQYRERALGRARAGASYIKSRLSSMGLSSRPRFVIQGRADDAPLRDNMVHSSSSTARRNREINRRVEIFLDGATAPRRKRKTTPDPATDWDAFLNTKLRQLGEFWSVHRPLDGDRVHACIRRKLLQAGVEDTIVQPIGRVGPYSPPASGPYVPEAKLRQLLISDLKKGYARGPIRNFDRRFNVHVDNLVKGVTDLGFRVTGQDIYDRRMKAVWNSVTQRSERARHLYSCKVVRQHIARANKQSPF